MKQAAARILSLLITLAFLGLMLPHLLEADLGRLLKGENLAILWFAPPLWAGGVLVRAWKYHLLLEERIGFARVIGMTLVRNAAVDLLPARSAALGLFLYMGHHQGGLRPAFTAGAFLYSAWYDQVAMLLLMLFLLPFLPQALPLALLLAAGALLCLLLWLATGKAGGFLLSALLTWKRLQGKKRLFEPLQVLEQMHRQQNRLGRRLLLLLLGWAGRVLKYLLAFIFFLFLTQEPFRPAALALFVPALALVELSSLLPLQGLGGFGTWEATFVVVFGRVFPGLENPLLTGLGLHLLSQVGEYLLGGGAWLTFVLGRSRQKGPQSGSEGLKET